MSRRWGDSSPRHWLNLDSEAFAWLVAFALVVGGLVWVGWR